MVMINRATKEITFKIVYYGPGLCGKTTNLEYVYSSANPERRGKLLTVATETDRTLFFDFMPLELGTIRGMKVRVQLYTVPGQVFYDATRRIVLRGSDGVVFVADSQVVMMDANLESVENLKNNLRLNNLDPETIPLVIQYNKQDLPNLSTREDLEARLNWRGVPSFLSVATKGQGVHETLRKITEIVIRKLQGQEIGSASQAKGAELVSPATSPSESTHPSEPPAPPPLAPFGSEGLPPSAPPVETEKPAPSEVERTATGSGAQAAASVVDKPVAVAVAHEEPELEEELESLPVELPPGPESGEIRLEAPAEIEVELELEPEGPAAEPLTPAAAPEPEPQDHRGGQELLADLRLRLQYFTDQLQALADEAEEIKADLEALERRLSE
jgi:signal recognition particle receptor subunit beta